MLVGESGNTLKLDKIWEIQRVVLGYPAFRGLEFKVKGALWVVFAETCRPCKNLLT